MRIKITRPQEKDTEEIRRLFSAAIADAFAQDGIAFRQEGIDTEVEKQMRFLLQDFETKGRDLYFLLARTDEKIVGTIAYCTVDNNDLIKSHLQIDFRQVPEVTTVYVLPEFQGKGVGSLLWNAILISLLHQNVQEICLDGGYKKSQSFWIKRAGQPVVTLTDYWGPGLDHMIWRCRLHDLPIQF